MANRWDGDALAAIRATPQKLFEAPNIEARFPHAEPQVRQTTTPDRAPRVYRLKITQGLLETYGYSVG